jgi:hypothetical protein
MGFQQWVAHLGELGAFLETLDATGRWRWLSEVESAEVIAGRRRALDQPAFPLPPDMTRESRERLDASAIIALGPTLIDRSDGDIYAEARLCFDRRSPNQLWLDLGMMPPSLWVPVGRSVESIDAALALYFPDVAPRTVDLPETARLPPRPSAGVLRDVYGGGAYAGGWDAESGVYQLARQCSMNLALENVFWGSAYDDDPFPEQLQGVSAAQLSAALGEALRQSEGVPASLTVRTRWSRSMVTFINHPRRQISIEARYRGSPHPAWGRDIVSRLGAQCRGDIPVDLVAAFLGAALL